MEPEVPTIQRLRAKFESARESAPAREVRAAAVAYYRARCAQGATQPEVAGELGLTQWTLAKWHQKHDVDEGQGDANERVVPAAASAECSALKEEIERLGPRSPSRRFPEELKQRVAQWARGELERGVGASALAEQVGVPWESISRWLGPRNAGASGEPKLRAVRVVGSGPAVRSAAEPRGLVLKSPHGFSVEGMDVPTLVEMLRLLG